MVDLRHRNQASPLTTGGLGAFTGGTGDILQAVSNMPKYWSTSGFEKSLPDLVNVARGQAPEDYASLLKTGFKSTRDKLLDLGTGMERGVFTGVGDKAQKVADWFAKPSFGKFGDWAQAATRGTGLGTPLNTTFSGQVPKSALQISRNLWGGLQSVIPEGWANKAFNLPGGGSMARIAKSAPTRFFSRALPGANIAMGGASAYDRFKKGQYLRGAADVVSMVPGPMGWAGLGAATVGDLASNVDTGINRGVNRNVNPRVRQVQQQRASTRPQAPPGQPVSGRHHGYQRGGSVNPHEETTRAARDWSPREQPRSEQALLNDFRSHYADRDRVGQPGLLNHRVNKFRDERNVNGDISNRTMHRDFSTFDTLQGNRVNQPGGRTSKLLITDNQNSDIDYYLRRIGTGGSGYEQHGVGGEQIPIQLTGGGQDYWHTEDTRNMLTAMNENSNFVQRPEFDMNQPSTWNRGGSVNPFEETARAGREYQPRSYPQDQSSMDSGLFSVRIDDPSVNEMRNNYMQVADNRTSINPMTWPGSQYFGMGGYDFVEDHAPTLENLAFFQDIKDKDAMARDAGFYPYFNPSLIEDNPSWGADYMTDLWGGKGRVGFRKGLDDDDYNAYANWGIEF